MATEPGDPPVSDTQDAPSSAPRVPIVPPRILSCLLCAQRKVKCDKGQPCANCAKVGVECIPGVATRPKRRGRRHAHMVEDLGARCARYERLLLSYGVKKEDLDSGVDINSLKSDFKSLSLDAPSPSSSDAATGSQIGTAPSHNNLWVSLSDEILESALDDESGEGLADDIQQHNDAMLFFGFGLSQSDLANTSPAQILQLWPSYLEQPSPVQMFQLWQTFLENVQPLVKTIHTPTVQKQILTAAGDLSTLSKSTQAVIFAIYASAVNSLPGNECEKLLGAPKSVLLPRFIFAVKHAMMAADILNTISVELLQAFSIYLMIVRGKYQAKALCMLTGIAVRMAQRLGLHREERLERLSVFEAEIGRRLWWLIMTQEANAAERAGVVNGVDSRVWDTKLPSNLNDSDLYPDMRELPQDHSGMTDMTFCLARYQVGEFLRIHPSLQGSWQGLTRTDVPAAEREKIVESLEDTLQRKYGKYLDASIPIHVLIEGVCKSVTGRMKLMCLHPRQYADRGASLPQEEKNKLFELCLDIVSRYNWIHSSPAIKKYLWNAGGHFQHDAFIYLINELRTEPYGSKADIGWPQVLGCLDHYPEFSTTKQPLFTAIGSLILKSWDARELAYARLGQFPPEGSPPSAIATLRTIRGKPISKTWQVETTVPDLVSGVAAQSSAAAIDNQSFNTTLGVEDIPMGLDDSSLDWNFWGDLMNGTQFFLPDSTDQQSC